MSPFGDYFLFDIEKKHVLSYNWRLLNTIILLCSFHRPNGQKVVLGVHSLSEAEDTKQTFDILELHNHPGFNPSNYDNDIALIKVRVKSGSVSVVPKCILFMLFDFDVLSQQQNSEL